MNTKQTGLLFAALKGRIVKPHSDVDEIRHAFNNQHLSSNVSILFHGHIAARIVDKD